MGILVANLPAFALPHAAYFSPAAWGGSALADLTAWFATYVLIESKMRGLFTVLFGASMLLVIDRARANGESAAKVHYSRMISLIVIGLLHLYLFWWGDILLHYALVGLVAYLFTRMTVRWLLICAGVLFVLQFANDIVTTLMYFDSAARDTPARIALWNQFAPMFGVPPAAKLAEEVAAGRTGFVTAAIYRWHHEASPFFILAIFGVQTLCAMLLGMAGYRSGFLTGAWDRARYQRIAIICLAIATPIYIALAINTLAHGFFPPWIFFASSLAAEPLRLVMLFGYAALLILMIRPGGRVTERVAAVGRAAFTNYLGTTLLMTFVFAGWGLGQFGTWSRAQLYLLVPVAWAIMLLWSKPWLDHYRFGPLEWAWRSLARLQVQKLRLAQ